jgi:hypothetical protein
VTRLRPPAPEPAALDLLEQAVHLLRCAPPAAWGSYVLGTCPFVLAFLYFWADMSRGSDAWTRCAAAAFGLALTYVWMKVWQAVFAFRLRQVLGAGPAVRWTAARAVGLALGQAILQPARLVVLPVSLLIALPFGWVLAFYEGVTVFGVEGGADVGALWRRSLRAARVWPRQNHLALGILALFGPVLAVNVALGLAQLPALAKVLLGVESAFTRSSDAFTNSTFLAACLALTYLVLDPLLKAFYVLRGFLGESIHSGEDLRVALATARRERVSLVAVLLLGALAGAPGALRAADAGTPPRVAVAPGAEAADLDRTISEVLRRPEFNWRLPREAAPAQADRGVITTLMDDVAAAVRSWGRTLARATLKTVAWLRRVTEWLGRRLFGEPRSGGPADGAGWGWLTSMHVLVGLLLAATTAALLLLLWRVWRWRGRTPSAVGRAVVVAPDLADAAVGAEQLPEEEWLRLAEEQRGRGNFRLALRALYLASLAYLARREWITLARHKSNRDYERELRRRARGAPELLGAFGANVTAFERAWFGRHDVTGAEWAEFESNVRRIRAC